MKKRLLILMLSACAFCAVSLRFLTKEAEFLSESTAEENRETRGCPVDSGERGSALETPEKTEESQPVMKTEETDGAGTKQDDTAFSGDGYAYTCLSTEEQAVYREIYDILKEFQEEKPISLKDPAGIGKIFQCVMNDHPEIFYVQGYTYTRYTSQDGTVKLTLSGTYTMTPAEAEKRQERMELYVQQCLNGIAEDASDYEKVKYVYEYLISHTKYRQNSPDNQNICSVFLNGESVCQGYAKATQYLLNRLGVFATLVIGSVSEGEGHAWNLVRMDGEYYYVDTTWGDASYQMEETKDAWNSHIPEINYDYLGVTTEQLMNTHQIDNVVPLPDCSHTKYNYYVQEGTYLTACEEMQLQQLFDEKYEQNGRFLTLKCADTKVYEEVCSLLIDEQGIFRMLHRNEGSVAYSDHREQLSLSFWE